MPNTDFDRKFWEHCDRMVSDSKLIIENMAGSAHPDFPDFIYPVDYGYLENTVSSDSECIDIWKGTSGIAETVGVIVTVDLLKRDAEVKLLYMCSEKEVEEIYRVHNYSDMQKGILIMRNKER